MEPSLPKNHEDHSAGKGFTSMTHYNLVRKFISLPHAMKIRDAKAAMDKEWKKLQTIPARQPEKAKNKKETILAKRQKESPLCCIDGHISPQKRGFRTTITNV